jgi:ArsR family transcriptional regulator
MKTQNLLKCTDCFRSVSVPSRMAIYNFISVSGGEATVGQVVDYIGLRQPTVSYHLKEMKDAGLLKSRKAGKEVFYSIHGICPNDGDVCIIHA